MPYFSGMSRYLNDAHDITCLIVTHDTEFMDNVVTDIIHYESRKLVYYHGKRMCMLYIETICIHVCLYVLYIFMSMLMWWLYTIYYSHILYTIHTTNTLYTKHSTHCILTLLHIHTLHIYTHIYYILHTIHYSTLLILYTI